MTIPPTLERAVDDELLPCPFCGSGAHVVQNDNPTPFGRHDVLFAVECTSKGCYAKTTEWYPESAAVAAWNRRAAQAKPDVEVVARAIFNGRHTYPWEDASAAQHGKYRNVAALAIAAMPQASDAVEVVRGLRETLENTRPVCYKEHGPNDICDVEDKYEEALTAADQWLAREGEV